MRKNLAIIFLLLVGGVLVYAGITSTVAQESGAGTPQKAQAEQQDTQPLPDRVLGQEDAPVTVIEYASFTCPHCASFHNTTFPQIKQSYINNGTVKFIFREFPFDRLAFLASLTARCVPENKYFDTVEMLFKDQSAWARSENPAAYFRQVATTMGADGEEYSACIADETRQKRLAAVRLEGRNKYNVQSTPSFVVNGKLVRGNRSFNEFSNLIEIALSQTSQKAEK